MSRVFYTSDLHLGHEHVARLRGHNTPLGAYDEIAEKWLQQVTKRDIVYVLGDVTLNDSNGSLEFLAGLPGRKHLVSGNHDSVHPMIRPSRERLARWFETFETIQPFMCRKVAGIEFALSHFPYESWGDGPERPGSRYNEWRLPDRGLPLVHGHTHGPERAHGRMFHVGWDAWRGLVPQEEIVDWLKGLEQ